MAVDKKDVMTKNSKFRDAILAVVLNPESWSFTMVEIQEAAGNFLRENFDKKAKDPSYSTVRRVMSHPDFQEEVRRHRKEYLQRCMPSVERSLVRLIVEGGDVRAYDRIIRALGEGGFHHKTFDDLSDEELIELAEKALEEN